MLVKELKQKLERYGDNEEIIIFFNDKDDDNVYRIESFGPLQLRKKLDGEVEATPYPYTPDQRERAQFVSFLAIRGNYKFIVNFK